jgi:hypothetical protein
LWKTSPSYQRKLTSVCTDVDNCAAFNLPKHWFMLERGSHAKA